MTQDYFNAKQTGSFASSLTYSLLTNKRREQWSEREIEINGRGGGAALQCRISILLKRIISIEVPSSFFPQGNNSRFFPKVTTAMPPSKVSPKHDMGPLNVT